MGLPAGFQTGNLTSKEKGGVAGLEPALGLMPVAKRGWLSGSNPRCLNQSSALTIFGHPLTLYEAGATRLGLKDLSYDTRRIRSRYGRYNPHKEKVGGYPN